jgi:hypothetical protein
MNVSWGLQKGGSATNRDSKDFVTRPFAFGRISRGKRHFIHAEPDRGIVKVDIKFAGPP